MSAKRLDIGGIYMALTGFDPQLVSSSINKVINAYNELINQIGDKMQSDFVNGMADKWACKQAQTFFNSGFKPTVDELIRGTNVTFGSVVDAMNSAATAWAQSTDSSYSPVSFSVRNVTMNTDNIMENINGVRGIDFQLASSVSAKLPVINSNAKEALNSAKTAVQGCGFIGGNQEEYLLQSLESIKTNIDNATTTITDQSKKAIDDTLATYTDVEGKVSQAFQGQ